MFTPLLLAATLAPFPPVPTVFDATSSAQYDPAATVAIGATYARLHLNLSAALANATGASAPPAELKRLRFRSRVAVDDAVRDRVAATLAGGDAAKAQELEHRIFRDELIDQATQAIRGYGLHENDLGEVTTALVAVAWNVEGNAPADAALVAAAARHMRAALAALPAIAALDDASKQTVATEMSYQIVCWSSDAATFAAAGDAASTSRLRVAVSASLASLGLAPGTFRFGETGIVPIPQRTALPAPRPSPKKASMRSATFARMSA